MSSHSSLNYAVGAFFTLILLILFWQGIRPEPIPGPIAFDPEETCKGEPIKVDVPYTGAINEPHTCAPQCADGKQRYILYSNDLATQCEILPGCNDTGEDSGVTCEPPKD